MGAIGFRLLGFVTWTAVGVYFVACLLCVILAQLISHWWRASVGNVRPLFAPTEQREPADPDAAADAARGPHKPRPPRSAGERLFLALAKANRRARSSRSRQALK